MSNTTETVHSPISLQNNPTDPIMKSTRAKLQKKIAEIGLGNQKEQLERIHDICKLSSQLGDFQKCGQYGRILLNQAREWKNDYYTLLGHNDIGCYYTLTGQWKKSIPCFEKCLPLIRKIEREDLTLTILRNLGKSYFNLANYRQALIYYQKHTIIVEKDLENIDNQIHEISNLVNIGIVYMNLKELEKALTYFEKAKVGMQKPLLASLIPIHSQLGVWYSLGEVHKGLQKFDTALDCLTQFKNLVIQKYHQKENVLSRYYISISDIYLKQSSPQKALDCFQKALEYSAFDEYHNTIIIYINMGYCYHTMRDFHKASDYYEKALKMKEKLPKFNLMDLYEYMQKNYLALGEYKLAYEFLEKHTQLKEEIMGGKTQKSIAELEKKVEIEREAKERINAEMKALRAQINPHFFFNTLNSIQHYIAQNQSEDAQRFLADFAALMRQTLNNSDDALVSVEKEINFIRSYLSLEQLRFEQKFDFQIDIDEEADIEALQMPPMLLQPYLENAILHGIQPKEGKGFIQVTLTEEADYLHICITDNGIGRAAAAMRKKQRLHSHKSMGTQIQNNRLKTINALYDQTIEIQTSDVRNELEEICGTKVELKVPIWEM